MSDLPQVVIIDPLQVPFGSDQVLVEAFLSAYYPAAAAHVVAVCINGGRTAPVRANLYAPVGAVLDLVYPIGVSADTPRPASLYGVMAIDSKQYADTQSKELIDTTQNKLNTQENQLMNNIVPVKTFTLVNGQDITRKTDDQLIDDIRQMEYDVKSLMAIGVSSRAINTKKNDVIKALKATVAELDSRFPESDDAKTPE